MLLMPMLQHPNFHRAFFRDANAIAFKGSLKPPYFVHGKVQLVSIWTHVHEPHIETGQCNCSCPEMIREIDPHRAAIYPPEHSRIGAINCNSPILPTSLDCNRGVLGIRCHAGSRKRLYRDTMPLHPTQVVEKQKLSPRRNQVGRVNCNAIKLSEPFYRKL